MLTKPLTLDESNQLIKEIRAFYSHLLLVWKHLDEKGLINDGDTEILYATRKQLDNIYYSHPEIFKPSPDSTPDMDIYVTSDKQQTEEWIDKKDQIHGFYKARR